MWSILLLVSLSITAHAARPFINEPDSGFDPFLPPKGQLPPLHDIWCMNDFDAAARNYMNASAYTWIRHSVSGEYSYRNNLEVFPKIGFKPRMLTGDTNVLNSLNTTILNNTFSLPLFISPAAAPGLVGGYVPGPIPHQPFYNATNQPLPPSSPPPDAEHGLIAGASTSGILYIPAQYAELSPVQMASAIRNSSHPDQVLFQQLYADPKNMTSNRVFLQGVEQLGVAKAIVWTIDAPTDGNRIRSERYTLTATTQPKTFAWDFYEQLKNMTKLPIIPKGVLSVEDAKLAVQHNAPAIIVSNHGARHLDTAPSPLQVAMQIRNEAPEIYNQTEVLADGGVRYGVDVLKFLALGVKAVGMGRVFMYANIYGQRGVERAVGLMRDEIVRDVINLGVKDLDDLRARGADWVDITYLQNNMWNLQ